MRVPAAYLQKRPAADSSACISSGFARWAFIPAAFDFVFTRHLGRVQNANAFAIFVNTDHGYIMATVRKHTHIVFFRAVTSHAGYSHIPFFQVFPQQFGIGCHG